MLTPRIIDFVMRACPFILFRFCQNLFDKSDERFCMPYNAVVIKVMIASPSDVFTERNIIREVLYEWNSINFDLRKVVLLPIAWETHSSPEMGDRPQAIINRNLLKDCDLLVGVFWTRIGTPTGEYESGTVEEIDEHIRAGKPAMLYFSSAPVVPDSVDSDQYSKLKNFKDSCKTTGLYETYSTINDFRTKFNRQLQQMLNNSQYFIKTSQLSSKDGIIVESTLPNIPNMTREAQILLKEASQAKDGNIFQLGFQVQSNGKVFGNSGNPKDRAIWEGTIDELETLGLIKDRGYKRELFGITRTGYQIAEMLSL